MRCGLVLLLLFAVAPGLGEVVENVVHLIAWSHPAHAQQSDDHHTQQRPEHGCTGTFHLCSCHSSSTGLRPARAPRARFPDRVAALELPHAGRTNAGFHHVPEHPPRA